MFCPNCGKQIPENTKFCSHCGAQQLSVSSADPATSTPGTQPNVAETPKQQPKTAPKKSVNIVVTLLVVLCAFLLGRFVIAPSLLSGEEPNPSNESSQPQQSSQSSQPTQPSQSSQPTQPTVTDPTVNTPISSYQAVFDGTYIIHFQSFFNMETASYASKQDNGIIACADYGYEDDVVKNWVETLYIPVSEFTDTEKAELESAMKSLYAPFEEIACCTVNYSMGANYYTVTFKYSNVDQAENYGALYDANILTANTHISMTATENQLLADGFVKK